jgi:hypothetical protein
MVPWQGTRGESVLERHRQWCKASSGNLGSKIARRHFELAECDLDRRLPHRDGTEEDVVPETLDRNSRGTTQQPGRPERPQQYMGVEKKPQSSSSSEP